MWEYGYVDFDLAKYIVTVMYEQPRLESIKQRPTKQTSTAKVRWCR